MTIGEWIRKNRRRKGLSQTDLAKKAGLTVDTLSRAELGKTTPQWGTLQKLCEVFGVNFEEIEPLLTRAFTSGIEFKSALEAKSERKVGGDAAVAQFEENVAPYSERPLIAEIPFFELELAAGNWTDVSDIGVVMNPRQIEQGLFRVRLRGDSMAPTYRDGDVIEFRVLRVDREGLVPGRDYYVQHVDGQATFKRVEVVTEETLILRPLNREKFKGTMQVERAMVVRAAMAVARVEML